MIPRNSIDVVAAEDARERFEAKRDERDGVSCWPWTADAWSGGYGRFYLDGHRYHAHRIAWVLAHGTDPGDDLVLHDCDTPQCVRPMHLYLGDQTNNMADAEYWRGPHVFSSLGEENPNAKLTVVEAREIRERCDAEDVTQAALGEEYGVSASTISSIVNEEAWTHV